MANKKKTDEKSKKDMMKKSMMMLQTLVKENSPETTPPKQEEIQSKSPPAAAPETKQQPKKKKGLKSKKPASKPESPKVEEIPVVKEEPVPQPSSLIAQKIPIVKGKPVKAPKNPGGQHGASKPQVEEPEPLIEKPKSSSSEPEENSGETEQKSQKKKMSQAEVNKKKREKKKLKAKEKIVAAEAEQTVPDTTSPALIHPLKYKAIPVDIPAAEEPKMHVIFQGEARKMKEKTIQEKAQEMIKSLDEENAAPIPEEKTSEEPEKKLSRKTLQKKHKREKNLLAQSMCQQTNALFEHVLEGKPLALKNLIPDEISSMRINAPIIPLARRDTKESSSVSPKANTLRHSAIIKKWQRLIQRVIKHNQLSRSICILSEYDKKIQLQSKKLNRLKNTTEVKLKQLCLPKENMHQNQLVDSYVEFNTVKKGKRNKL